MFEPYLNGYGFFVHTSSCVLVEGADLGLGFSFLAASGFVWCCASKCKENPETKEQPRLYFFLAKHR